MPSEVFVLNVNVDTWKADRWQQVAAFQTPVEAEVQGLRFRDEHGPYSGYYVRPVPIDPSYEAWNEGEEDEDE